MKSKVIERKLYERVISDENIYLAIYYVESYIQEKDLLSRSDRILLKKLVDKFNAKLISVTIKKVKTKLKLLLDEKEDSYIETLVYFKPKKYKNKEFKFRPIHTASLIDQIALISMLQVLIYDFDSKNKIIPSALSRLLPTNFYGNRISFTSKELFKNWKSQYGEYIEQSEKLYTHYNETGEYLYQVSLDLKNFFPNINPSILYNYILSKIGLIFSNDDRKILELILKKLLIFKLCQLDEIETKWYLSTDEYKEISYVKGLPQGLPHTYFMANIFMLLVEKEYYKEFPGKMLFYVDDSIMFSNFTEKEFANKIENLNTNFKSCFNEYLFPSIIEEYDANEFQIKVHEYSNDTKSKSNFIKISSSYKTDLLAQIRTLTRQVSEVQSFNTILSDDNELISYLNKLNQSDKLINTILDNHDKAAELYDTEHDPDNLPIQKNLLKPDEEKKLLRYKKFFGFRKFISEYVLERVSVVILMNNIQTQLNDIIEEIYKGNFNSFIDSYVNDILNFTLSYLYINISNNKSHEIVKLYEEINSKIEELCKIIYKKDTKYAYFSIQNYKKSKSIPNLLCSITSYSTLTNNLCNFYHEVNKFSLEHKNNLFYEILNNNIENLYNEYGLQQIYNYAKIVNNNHDELNRKFLNAIFSSVYNMPLTDEISFINNMWYKISYTQLRLVMMLRNKLFNYNEFKHFYFKIIETEAELDEDIDCYILQVLPYFIKKAKKIKYVDNLILIHKYCADTWKNGSKFLHFYTIHNQEHAISLIKLTKKLTGSFSLLQIKPLDYYLLYAACYLHDISMVTLPNFDNFVSSNSPEVIKIYNDFITNLNINDYKKTKSDLIYNFNKLDSYFENEIRKNHAFSSAHEIRKFSELSYIEPTDREVIAHVSEAHGYDTENVYGVKSYGKESLYNLKFMIILLRLADLLDINKHRISKVILEHNLEKLSTVSRFHWLSHLITDGCELYNKYYLNMDKRENKYEEKKEIIEKTIIKIKVSLPQITKVEKNNCSGINCFINKDNTTYANYCLLSIKPANNENNLPNSNDVCCNFACKWFIKKNKYLLDEIKALETYLNRVNDNNYKTQIEILLDITNNITLPPKYFDYLKLYVEEEK